MKYGALVLIKNPNDAFSAFESLKNKGFDCCQIIYKPKKYELSDAQTLKEAAQRAGVEMTAQFCGFYDSATVWDNDKGFLTAGLNIKKYAKSRLAYVKEAARFVAAAGIPDIVVHAGFAPNNPYAKEYKLLIKELRELTAHCKTLGLNVCLETGQEAPLVLLRMIEDVGADNLFVNFDTGNVLLYGYGNPVDAARVFGKYVRSVHGKDGCLPESPRKLGKETRLGEGYVDFPVVFGMLKGFGFDRCIIIEREFAGGAEAEQKDILDGKAFLEKTWNEALPISADFKYHVGE